MKIEVGAKYIFRCKQGAAFLANKEEFPTLHGLAAHSGQVVTAMYCVPTYRDDEPLVTITAADGWRSTVLSNELEPVR